MARKRRYYREERRLPVYLEEADDDFDEEDEPPQVSERFIRNTSWSLLGVLALGTVLSVAQSFFAPSSALQSGDRYQVVSVSRGQLHTKEMGTGKTVSFKDQKLVKAALDGSIRRGDVIYRYHGVMRRSLSPAF